MPSGDMASSILYAGREALPHLSKRTVSIASLTGLSRLFCTAEATQSK